ncbi:hypothetical protein CTI14_54260, partial [Methylobacterium radiotolerans]
QDHQILYLTCHPANAELLAQASAGVQVISLPRQEQLYLAVRLGLARALGQRTARLPLVMDDILVNADPDRAAAVAAALADARRTTRSCTSPVIPRTRSCSPRHRQACRSFPCRG